MAETAKFTAAEGLSTSSLCFTVLQSLSCLVIETCNDGSQIFYQIALSLSRNTLHLFMNLPIHEK